MRRALNSLIYILCILLVLAGINYISVRHYSRMDLTRGEVFSLSDKSKAIVRDLIKPVEIYVYMKPDHELTPLLKHLLKMYQLNSQMIQVTWIDPYHDISTLSKLGSLVDNFKLNSILVKNEKRHKFLTMYEIGVYDRKLEVYGVKPKLINFNGEAAITGALLDLSNFEPPLVGLIMNHGERNPNSTEDDGISAFVQHMMLEGFRFSFINLKAVERIPEEVNILMSSQPRLDYTKDELDILDEYLRNGGSLFFALDPLVSSQDTKMMNFGILPLLSYYGILLEETVVVDPSKQIAFSRPDNLYIDAYSDFKITENMQRIPTIFFQARSMQLQETKGRTLIPLLATSEKAWGETLYANPNYEFKPDEDKKGPNYISVVSFDNETKSKLMVFGDSDFMSNGQIKNPGNMQLLQNCFYWLTDKSELLDIPPKGPGLVSLSLGKNQLLFIFFSGVVFPPLFVLITGWLIWFRRR